MMLSLAVAHLASQTITNLPQDSHLTVAIWLELPATAVAATSPQQTLQLVGEQTTQMNSRKK